jgi:hypothetical protein
MKTYSSSIAFLLRGGARHDTVVGGTGIAGFRGGDCGGGGSGARMILDDLALGQAVRRLSTTGLEEIARRILGRFFYF